MDEQTKTIRLRGKKWKVPEVLGFKGDGIAFDFHFYNAVDYRAPKKGEYYLSGGQVWTALNDLSTPFVVVEKTYKAKRKTVWIRELKS